LSRCAGTISTAGVLPIHGVSNDEHEHRGEGRDSRDPIGNAKGDDKDHHDTDLPVGPKFTLVADFRAMRQSANNVCKPFDWSSPRFPLHLISGRARPRRAWPTNLNKR
jgi:hypothetical protein